MNAPPDVRTPGEVGTDSRALREEDERSVAKAFSSLQARFALRGFTVQQLTAGGYLVARWNLSRVVPSLSALGAFAQEVSA